MNMGAGRGGKPKHLPLPNFIGKKMRTENRKTIQNINIQ
jgi:hypothetical protein